MKIKHLIMYIEWYVINLPMYIYHEVSHWLFIVPFWMVGMTSFPRVKITRWASWKLNDSKNGYEQFSHYMHVVYRGPKWIGRISAAMPIPATIFLFIISPWWLYPLYISQLSTLWISIGDYNQIMGMNKTTKS